MNDIKREMLRIGFNHGEQNHPNGTSLSYVPLANLAKKRYTEAGKNVTWRHILEEEVLEAFAELDPKKLREELVQVAAVTMLWIECLDRKAK